MTDIDSLLQERLAAIEAGQPLETVLADLPEQERKELEALLRLASVLRDMPHPMPADSQRAQIMAAAEIQTQPLPKPGPWAQPTQPLPRKVERKPLRWVWSGSLSFSAAFAALLCIGAALVLSLFTRNDGARAHLENVRGQVQVASNRLVDDWQAAQDGEVLRAGQRLRTLDGASVTLVFYEGTRTTLSDETELTITHLSGSRSKGGLKVELAQTQGQTAHQVIPLTGNGSFFRVSTPGGQATVHGTRFNVFVTQNGQSVFSVNTGEVRVQNENAEVTLLAGQSTAGEPGQPPAGPAYQFNAQGSLLDNEGSTWAVSGATFNINEWTYLDDDLQVGQVVVVSGRILENGDRVADRVERTEDPHQATIFTGTLEAMQGDTWQVNGIPLTVTPETELAEGLSVGATVRVVANILNNGNWLALSISALEEEPVKPQPTATALPRASSTPVPSATPGSASAAQPSDAQATCPGNEEHPTGLTLAQRYGVPYEEIMAWFCQNYGFGEIDLAYSLSQQSGLNVAEIFDMRESGTGWGDLKKQLAPDNNEKPAHENNGNDNDNGKPDDKQDDKQDKDKDKDKDKNKEKTPKP